METKIQKPQHISYVRYAKKEESVEAPEQKSDSHGKIFIYGLIAYSFALLFTPGWVIGLPVVGTAAVSVGVHKLIQYKNSPKEPKLVINYNR